MLKKMIATTIGITAAAILTFGSAQADEKKFEVKDCRPHPYRTVQCDKIVFHPPELEVFYCPIDLVAPTQFDDTGLDEIEFRHTDLIDIRIKDQPRKINDVKALAALYLRERGCVRSRPGFRIGPESIIVDFIGYTSLAPSETQNK